ncbi:hypothetical protein SUGI_0633080 [Cryptomeria japonica]|nr:hypothetical protein SUGI_0633080 [Cryptomeria japonica]
MANGGTPAPNSQFGLPYDEAPEMKSWISSAIKGTEINLASSSLTTEKSQSPRWFFNSPIIIAIDNLKSHRPGCIVLELVIIFISPKLAGQSSDLPWPSH